MAKLKIIKKLSFSKAQLIAFILTFACVGGYFLLNSFAAGTTANLWIDTNGGTCTRQTTPGAYVDAQACSSFNAAYLAASAGDIIAIQPGNYGAQSIADRTNLAIGSAKVTFCVASGDVTLDSGSVAANGLNVATHDVTVSGAYCGLTGQQTDHMTIPTSSNSGMGISGPNGPDLRGVTLDNIHGATVFTDSWGATIRYSEIGPAPSAICAGGGQDDSIKVWWHGADETNPNHDTTIAYNYIHGNACATGQHNDSIQAESTNLLVVGNRMSHCGQIFTESVANSALFGNYTGNILRNNFIEELNTPNPGQPANWCDQQAVSSGPPYTLEYNTIDGWVTATSSSSLVRGNIFLNNPSVGTADHNVVPSGATGTNKACTPRLASGSLWTDTDQQAEYHLSASDTCAAGAGNPTNFPTTDIDENTRSSPPDAGADEIATSGNVWMATTGNDSTCVRSDQSKPCLTPAKAWSIALAGDVIVVADGMYGTNGCSFSGSKASTVTFTGTTNAKFPCQWEFGTPGDNTNYHAVVDGLSLMQLHTTGNYVTVKNGLITCSDSAPYTLYSPNSKCSSRVAFDGPSSNVVIQNETIGPSYESGACGGNAPNGSAFWGVTGPTTLKNVNIIDSRRGCGGNAQHEENLRVDAGNSNVTLDGVVFYNGPNSGEFVSGNTFDGSGADSAELFITGTQTNFILQNSYCYGAGNVCIDGASDSNFAGTSYFRNNVLYKGTLMQHAYPSTFLVTDNVFDDCPIGLNGSSGGTIRRNLGIGNSACNGSDTNTSQTWAQVFTDPVNGDFSLKAGSAAIDVGGTTAGDYAQLDKAGAARYAGVAADAGAYEFGSSGGAGDTTSPTVSITAPSAGVTVSGSAVVVSANASDNIGVAGVQFKLDGSNLGSEDTSSPYSVAWDSTAASNGSHSLTAVARDAAGNTATSSSVTVTVTGGTNTFTIGETNILAGADNGNANLLLAQSASLTQTATIQSLSFYVTSAAGNLRLGIYDATGPGGGPGALKAQTAELVPTTGWNTAAVTNPVSLNAGTYWLAYFPSSNSLAFVKNSDASSSGKLYSLTYGVLPATFSTTPSSTPSHWSLYATFSLNSGPIPGDLNNDSHVTILDLSILLSHYGQSATASQGDINSDGTCNILDLSILLSHYGT